MILEENRTYYDILDISPDASTQEIREAYVRIKSTYNRDNLVLYSLVTPEEREETLTKIETAYAILSDREKRKDYDENQGILGNLDNPFAPLNNKSPEKIVSIDRVPPMEQSEEDFDILVPPSTDFNSRSADSVATRSSKPNSNDIFNDTSSPFEETANPFGNTSKSPKEIDSSFRDTPSPSKKTNTSSRGLSTLSITGQLAREIELEAEWHGPFLKKIREAYKISIEELSNTTKITKTYLHAIEADNFAKLPAPVYVRGFITQIAKALKLVPERVVPVYMTRFKGTTGK